MKKKNRAQASTIIIPYGQVSFIRRSHLQAPGVAKVVLTAPGKGDVPNIVYGINDDCIVEEERILSAGSCTTNAIVPVLKVVHDRYGIASGHIETCHSYTNDQNLIDNYHKHERRGRGAPRQ